MILFILLAQPSSNGDANVALDDERLQDDVPKGLQKVELDLDDALFLEFEETEAAPPTPTEPVPEAEPEEGAAPVEAAPAKKARIKRPSKKIILLAAAILACLLLGAGGAYFFMKSGSKTSTEKTPVLQEKATQGAENGSSTPESNDTAAPAQPPRNFTVETFPLDQFQVEYTLDGQMRFLTCRFSIPDSTPTLRGELQLRTVLIRDGVYRYLKNSPPAFLANTENSEKLKSDIVVIINQFLKSGQISQILLEEYVVK